MSTDIQSVGRVYVFRSLTLLQLLEGKDEFEQCGFLVKIAVWNGDDVAIVSSVSGGYYKFSFFYNSLFLQNYVYQIKNVDL